MIFFEVWLCLVSPLLALAILGAISDRFGTWLDRRYPGRFGFLWIEEDET